MRRKISSHIDFQPSVVTFEEQRFVFSVTHFVDAVIEPFGELEVVKRNLVIGIGGMLPGGIDERRSYIHRSGLNA